MHQRMLVESEKKGRSSRGTARKYIKWGLTHPWLQFTLGIKMRIILLPLFLCTCAYGQQESRRRQDYYDNDDYKEDRAAFGGQGFQGLNEERREFRGYRQQPSQLSSNAPIHVPDVKYPVTPIPIIRLNKQQSLDGSYKTSYETGNSIVAEETGFVKAVGAKGEKGLVQYGSYSYTDPDGHVITVRYTADEGGFRAEGDHLPTPPPIPDEIQKGLDVIFESIRLRAEKQARDKRVQGSQLESSNYPPEEDDGSYRPEYDQK